MSEKAKLLSNKDIQTMRSEVTNRPIDIKPPLGRSYWGVDRIVTTLEHSQGLNKEAEEALNEAIELINNGFEKKDLDYRVVRSLIAYALWKLREGERR